MKVKLGDVCDVFSGFAFKSFNEIQKGNPVIKIGNILADGNISYESCVYSEEKPDKKYYSKVNDIYIALSGATTGKVGLMNKSDFLINQRVGVVRLKDKKIPVKYLYAFLQSKSIKILRDAFGAAQPNISPRDILNYEINVGQNYEMEEIANKLDKINELMEKRKCQLEKLDLLIKSKFIEMFGNAVYNDKAWAHYPMSTVAPIGTYRGKIEPEDGKFWLLNLDMVEAQTGEIIQEIFVDFNEIGASTVAFNKDNVLYSKLRPYLNKVVNPKKEGYATSELVPLKPKQSILNKVFLTALLRSDAFVHYIQEQVAGAKMPRVSMDVFRKFEVICPPIGLQDQFAQFVEQSDKSKLKIKQSLGKLETLKKSLMQKYFG